MSAPVPTGEEFVTALSATERKALLAAGRKRHYARQARLFHEGDRSDFVALVLTGRVKIVVSADNGGESVLGVRGPGALIGELAALDSGPRLGSAVALEPVEVRLLSAAEFRGFLAEHPSAALVLVRMLVGRLREADRRRMEFGAYDVGRRVALVLAELSGAAGADHGNGKRAAVVVKLSQQELAAMVGASRESVARALATLRDRGILTTGRRSITILEPTVLATVV